MKHDSRQAALFDIGPRIPRPNYIKRLQNPVWTSSKAWLIARYLRFFVFITKHGTYFDAFAGPQYRQHLEMWSARLVLENQPPWLRNFYLFEHDARQLEHLRTLAAEHEQSKGRVIRIEAGDCNVRIPEVLAQRGIRDREATFCLLDQRTFECHWSTVRALAQYKPPGQNKIELFYFIPNWWLPRAMAGIKNRQILDAWWGRPDWQILQHAKSFERARLFAERFESELGYAHVNYFPIMNRRGGSKIMYYMLHATDHPEAPKLMARAYRKATDPEESAEQLELFFARRGGGPGFGVDE